VFVLYAAEKVMRSSTCFMDALKRKVSILKTLDSPEANSLWIFACPEQTITGIGILQF